MSFEQNINTILSLTFWIMGSVAGRKVREENKCQEGDTIEDEDVITKPTSEEVVNAFSVLEDLSICSNFENNF